jgi:hypothetical protein
MDFFTAEVLTLKRLLTYYVLFFIHLETRRVSLAGFTPYPDQDWVEQQARNMTMEEFAAYHEERNHQGKEHRIFQPDEPRRPVLREARGDIPRGYSPGGHCALCCIL